MEWLKMIAWCCGLWRVVVCTWALFCQLTCFLPPSQSLTLPVLLPPGNRLHVQLQRRRFLSHNPFNSDPSVNVPPHPSPDGPPLPAFIRRHSVPLLAALLVATFAYLTGFAFQQPTLIKAAIFTQVAIQATMSFGLVGREESAIAAPLRNTLDLVVDSVLLLIMAVDCAVTVTKAERASSYSKQAFSKFKPETKTLTDDSYHRECPPTE